MNTTLAKSSRGTRDDLRDEGEGFSESVALWMDDALDRGRDWLTVGVELPALEGGVDERWRKEIPWPTRGKTEDGSWSTYGVNEVGGGVLGSGGRGRLVGIPVTGKDGVLMLQSELS